jgi:hypothetical protein
MPSRRVLKAALPFFCCCLAVGVDTATAQSGSGGPGRITLDPPLMVTSDAPLRDVVQDAEAVVLVRVNRRIGTRIVVQQTDVTTNDGDVIQLEPWFQPFREYDVTPLEVLKASPDVAPDSAMFVASRGGVGQFNGVVYDEHTYTPELVVGRWYLLFLRFSEPADRMVFYTYDVFDFTGEAVEAHELLRRLAYGKELVGLSPERALRTLRAMITPQQ